MHLDRTSVIVLLTVACVAIGISSVHAADPCQTTSVGIDTSLADGIGAIIIHGSTGQTFVTADTLVTSFTIWRAPFGYAWEELRPKFVEADSTGRPLSSIVWQGPGLVLPNGGSVLMPYTWTFDPPLALPHRGRYAWYVCSGDIDLLAVVSTDVYPEGHAWGECRGACGPVCRNVRDYDLVFNITFCSDRPTPIRPHTWGRLKAIYR